jgi:hypothetical protein
LSLEGTGKNNQSKAEIDENRFKISLAKNQSSKGKVNQSRTVEGEIESRKV